jgi:hypothetical protein
VKPVIAVVGGLLGASKTVELAPGVSLSDITT